MKFDNSYRKLPERFYAPSKAMSLNSPKLIAINQSLANELDFSCDHYSQSELALIFSGQTQLEGAEFISLAYSGHQFGHFVSSLGDGRAILMGEVVNQNGKRYDLQLKGAGPTPFSRRGDGKSALGPVIREYIVSEAMHHLGIPTTRALAAVATGESVFREENIPGGIFTRVASSHLRIGTFEYFASRNDSEAMKVLIDHALSRHYPNHREISENSAVALLKSVIEAQTTLVAHWMSVGFIHGVMNTDNVSISGETLDFGPCAFMDHFNFNQVYSYIDSQGRYAYSNQPKILLWNMSRLANCLIPLVHDDEKSSIEELNQILSGVQAIFKSKLNFLFAKKLGIEAETEAVIEPILAGWLNYLNTEKMDFTLAHRRLHELIGGERNTKDSFFKESELFRAFLEQWHQLHLASDPKELEKKLLATNPLYIPRNHQVEKAIAAALLGDYSIFNEMNQLLQHPFTAQAGLESYSLPPRENEKIRNTFCGT